MGRFALVGALTAALAIGEIGVRLTGVAYVPLYRADPQLGYIVQPNQRGAVLGYDYVFNELSMGSARPFRPSSGDAVLIGDSVVMGGNHLRQAERLGERLGYWPISAGSWGVRNELAYFQRFPQTARTNVVWVLNSQDFGPASVWKSESTHPTHRPTSALLYFIQRRLAPRRSAEHDQQWGWERAFADFARGRNVLVVLYPQKSELKAPDELEAVAARLSGVDVLKLWEDPRWTAALYGDGIHPNAEGTRVLAEIIRTRFDSTRR